VKSLCPFGQPEKALGHEPQIDPWCALSSALIRRVEIPPVLG